MLTQKQEMFVQGIIEGKNQADAYRSAYNCKTATDKTVWEKASRLMTDKKVQARLAEVRDALMKPTIMTAQDRLEWLTEIIKNEEERTENRLKAADIMNKMQGEYVTKVEADVKGDVSINIELSDE